MIVFWIYLMTALVTGLLVIYMMLGAWMGVPILPTECFSLLGSTLVLIAAYISLSFRKTAPIVALIGLVGISSYWVYEPIRTMRKTHWSAFLICLLMVVLLLCAGSAYLAIKDLRCERPVPVSRQFRSAALSVSGACFVLIVVALYWQHKASERHPSYYYIPDGYVGWVVIHFGVPNTPATPIRGGAYEFRIPDSGEYSTSSEQEFGWAHDRFFYANRGDEQREIMETGWGAGGMIWNESSGTQEEPGKRPDQRQQFFVGTEEQLHQLGEGMDGIEPGNIVAPKAGAR